MTKKKYLLLALLLAPFIVVQAQKQFQLKSPDNKLTTDIVIGNDINYSVLHQGDVMLSPSTIAMQLTDGSSFGVNPKLAGSSTKTVNEVINSPIYKKSQVVDNFNELTLRFKGDYAVIFRAYNDGVAYRFVSTKKQDYIVANEQVTFNFPTNAKAFVAYVDNKEGAKDTFEKQFYNSFENQYEHIALSNWDKKRLAFSPLVVEGVNGKKVCIVESDLLDYPGMFLFNKTGANQLEGVFAPYPKATKQGGHNELQDEVLTGESYIAKCKGQTTFPWRAVIITENDAQLTNSDMVYKLAAPASKNIDYSWIKPGKVAWEWWNSSNLSNVDFVTGINNDTYKYYIDFASKYGIEYVILDEGWAVNLQADLFQVVPEINLPELVAYAKARNVDLILWAGYYAFNKDIEGICKHYSELGIKGFKIDFMDRDDQLMVDFHNCTAQIAAKYKMLVDFHGSYKPTGLQRTYPNVINFEGVFGLEQMKWSPTTVDQVTYDVTMPFIRMVAGPVDYTQGAMRNATRDNYYPVNSEAMSQGTRCRQLAEYIVFESPLNMLCDSPSNYMRNAECTEFIASVPTVWDETVSLNGEISKYVTIARRKGDVWYLGSMTNWDDRKLTIDLSFLGEGNYKAEVFCDGINANRIASDYKKMDVTIPANRKLDINMASGGGYAMKITKLP